MMYVPCVHVSAYLTPLRRQGFKCHPTRIFAKQVVYAGSLYKYLLVYTLDLESKCSRVKYTLYSYWFTTSSSSSSSLTTPNY